MLIRDWTEADIVAVDALLDPEPDPLWAGQAHRLHGAARDGERWRRTFVGEQDGRVVGAVTVGRNYVHPGRYSCVIEVAPAYRRQGLGRMLVEVAREVRPEPLPLTMKVREKDAAATALLSRFGGAVYQRAPCPVVMLDDPRVSDWCAAHRGEARPLTGMSHTELAKLFANQYQWVHEGWSSVGSQSALAEVSELMATDLDVGLSAGLWRGDRLAAVAFAFASGNEIEVVAETMHRDEPAGTEALGAAVAAMLTAAADAGVASVEFDGHDNDPHLAPLVATMPVARSNPLLMIEVS